MAVNRKLNWRPSRPDFRDLMYRSHPIDKCMNEVQLPSSVDLRPLMPPIVDQGDIGSCTGNAIAGALGFLELKEMKDTATGADSAIFNPSTFKPYSRLFIYWNEREEEGDTSQDAGAAIRDGILAVRNVGVCSELTWAYNQANLFTKPNAVAFSEASQHKIPTGYRLDEGNLQQMKQCLANGFPFVMGISVFDSFMSDEVAKTGKVPMPTYNDACEGGHAVCAVGYDDAIECFIVRNSWGETWGDKGYFYLPYKYVGNPMLTTDIWTIRRE